MLRGMWSLGQHRLERQLLTCGLAPISAMDARREPSISFPESNVYVTSNGGQAKYATSGFWGHGPRLPAGRTPTALFC
ncbi:hypothetical protein FA13DRAFT_1730380, partial [Coprinellus micaceus]